MFTALPVLLSLIDLTRSNHSTQDLVGDLHGYPRIDKGLQELTGTLGDLLSSISQANVSIDITNSPMVPSSVLQQKLNILLLSNDLEGGLVIIAHGMPVNLINTSSLKKAMGTIRNGSTTACLLSPKRSDYPQQGIRLYERESDLASYSLWHGNEADLTSYLLPVSLPKQPSRTTKTDKILTATNNFGTPSANCVCSRLLPKARVGIYLRGSEWEIP